MGAARRSHGAPSFMMMRRCEGHAFERLVRLARRGCAMSAPQVLPNILSAHPRECSPGSVDAREVELYRPVPVATIMYVVRTRGGAAWETVRTVATELGDADVGGIGPDDCGTATCTTSIDDFTRRGMSGRPGRGPSPIMSLCVPVPDRQVRRHAHSSGPGGVPGHAKRMRWSAPLVEAPPLPTPSRGGSPSTTSQLDSARSDGSAPALGPG